MNTGISTATARIVETPRTGCLVQLLWFVVVGWWLGLLWTAAAWFFLNTYFLIPVGVLMLNQVPQVMALRGRRIVDLTSGRTIEPQQFNLILRAIYFLLVGWWLSGIWLTVAYICCATIIFMPIGFKMFDLTPFVVSLRQ
jgi:uncharacterized membrane protein YccF (DUF307 family)